MRKRKKIVVSGKNILIYQHKQNNLPLVRITKAGRNPVLVGVNYLQDFFQAYGMFLFPCFSFLVNHGKIFMTFCILSLQRRKFLVGVLSFIILLVLCSFMISLSAGGEKIENKSSSRDTTQTNRRKIRINDDFILYLDSSSLVYSPLKKGSKRPQSGGREAIPSVKQEIPGVVLPPSSRDSKGESILPLTPLPETLSPKLKDLSLGERREGVPSQTTNISISQIKPATSFPPLIVPSPVDQPTFSVGVWGNPRTSEVIVGASLTFPIGNSRLPSSIELDKIQTQQIRQKMKQEEKKRRLETIQNLSILVERGHKSLKSALDREIQRFLFLDTLG